jgi:hypothetical protein
MTCAYYRTSSPVTALPLIMRWISDVPSKIVKLVEVRAVSAGRGPVWAAAVSTNSARIHGHCWRQLRVGFDSGRSVVEVATAGELHEHSALCPICCYLAFEIKPLIELDSSFAMGRERLPGDAPGVNRPGGR